MCVCMYIVDRTVNHGKWEDPLNREWEGNTAYICRANNLAWALASPCLALNNWPDFGLKVKQRRRGPGFLLIFYFFSPSDIRL